MTKLKGKSRDIDNRRLMSLTEGKTYVPALKEHISWEGFGERAISILFGFLPGLRAMVSQEEKVHAGGRIWHPDYGVEVGTQGYLVEVKGHDRLPEPKVREKLAASELVIARDGKRLLIFDARRLAYSTELRNAQLLRRYARRSVSQEVAEAVCAGFKPNISVELGAVVASVERVGMAREDIYALICSGVLAIDWSVLLDEDSLVTVAESSARSGLLPGWLTSLLA